jgi:hypothetical protein
LVPTQPPLRRISVVFSPEVKLSERETDHSLESRNGVWSQGNIFVM